VYHTVLRCLSPRQRLPSTNIGGCLTDGPSIIRHRPNSAHLQLNSRPEKPACNTGQISPESHNFVVLCQISCLVWLLGMARLIEQQCQVPSCWKQKEPRGVGDTHRGSSLVVTNYKKPALNCALLALSALARSPFARMPLARSAFTRVTLARTPLAGVTLARVTFAAAAAIASAGDGTWNDSLFKTGQIELRHYLSFLGN